MVLHDGRNSVSTVQTTEQIFARSRAMHAYNRLQFKSAHTFRLDWVLYIESVKRPARQLQAECVGICETEVTRVKTDYINTMY